MRPKRKLTPSQELVLMKIPDTKFLYSDLHLTSAQRTFFSSLIPKGFIQREYCIDPGQWHPVYFITPAGRSERDKLLGKGNHA